MADEALFRGRSSAESDVIHAVWKEIGGELVEEFVVPITPGQLSRARHIDGVFAVDGPRRWHPARTPLALRGCDIAVCQAKAAQLDLGVLGQTLFAAELIQREHPPHSMRLIAAAVQPNPSIEHLLESCRPFGRHIEHRTYPHLKPGRSSGATAPAVMRQALVSALHSEAGGLLIAAGSGATVPTSQTSGPPPAASHCATPNPMRSSCQPVSTAKPRAASPSSSPTPAPTFT